MGEGRQEDRELKLNERGHEQGAEAVPRISKERLDYSWTD